MSSSIPSQGPTLRALDVKPVYQGGKTYFLLRDPLSLAEEQLIIPQEFGPLLALFDGTRDASALSAALAVRYGQNVSGDEIQQLITALDKTYLLENDRFLEARETALAEFRRASFREPILAGISYPSEPEVLKEHLQGYIEHGEIETRTESIRGLVSPHIDYERGGTVYGQVWGQAAEAVRQAELVIILGTDHFSEENPITLTRQNYATPYGILPTATSLVDSLTNSIDQRILFNAELYHKAEHSIELAAVWLHHIREGEPCEILPILCGSFERFIKAGANPDEDPLFKNVQKTLHSAIGNLQTLVVVAGDLAHVGPAFGGYPLDLMGRARLKAADLELIECMCAGDRIEFLQSVRLVEDRNNVCGVPPIYIALQLLSPVQGEMVAYDLCPADQQGTSVVSICGMVFT